MENDTPNEDPATELYAKRWVALIGISALSVVVFIDFTIVNTILPGIQRELNATVDQLQWMINSFILMLTVLWSPWAVSATSMAAARCFTPASSCSRWHRSSPASPGTRNSSSSAAFCRGPSAP